MAAMAMGVVKPVQGLLSQPVNVKALKEAPEMPGWAKDPDGTGYIRLPA